MSCVYLVPTELVHSEDSQYNYYMYRDGNVQVTAKFKSVEEAYNYIAKNYPTHMYLGILNIAPIRGCNLKGSSSVEDRLKNLEERLNRAGL